MKGFFNYLRAQTLRSVKIYPILLAFSLITALCAGMLLTTVFPNPSGNEAEEQPARPIRIALVGELGGSYLDIGITAMETFDASRFYLELIPTVEAEAQKMLQRDEITGYLEVPEGFVQSVLRGKNLQLTFVRGNNPSSLGTMMVYEILQIVSDYVTESQNGIYGTLTVAELEGRTGAAYKQVVEEINLTYISSLLNRSDMVRSVPIGAGNNLDFKNYYVCATVILLMLLWGMLCVPLLIKTDDTLPRLLYARGQRCFSQVLGEWLPFLGLLLSNLLLLFLGLSALPASKLSGVLLFEQAADPLGFIALVFRLLPALMAISAMQFFLCELFHGIVSGALAQFFCAVALAYVSGLIYPLYSMPLSIQQASNFLPTGIAFKHAAFVMTGRGESAALAALLCTAVLLATATLARKIRIGRERS